MSSTANFKSIPILLSCFAVISAIFCVPQLYASPAIDVISPRPGASVGSPVFFDANATSTCPKGIAAMRIYTAPGVSAYTTQSAHLETFIDLGPGTYNTVVQAWDNCGTVSKFPLTLTVTSEEKVSVFLPNTGASFAPTHFAASAQSPSCAAGIAAMRIYTSWGVTPYTVFGNKLNADVHLGTAPVYYATIQAWDNCGKVLKSNFQISGSGDADAFLYTVDQTGQIATFNVLSNERIVADNPPLKSSSGSTATSIVKHPGGWFVYVSAITGIFGYYVNHSTGNLIPIQGSPFFSNTGFGPLFMDPTGNFLYALVPLPTTTGKEPSTDINSYKIDRSSGVLTLSSSTVVPQSLTALTTDPDGLFLYATGGGVTTDPSHIYGYKVNPNTGALTPVPGSPFEMPDVQYAFALSSAYQYLFVGTATSGGDVRSYQINYNSGSLYPPLGPYPATGVTLGTQAMLADWLARYVWTGNEPTGSGENYFWLFNLDGYTGSLGAPHYIGTGNLYVDYLTEGNSANAVFAVGGPCGPVLCVPAEASAWTWASGGDGSLELINTVPTGSSNPVGLTVVRANPD